MARTCAACGRANDDDASFCQQADAALRLHLTRLPTGRIPRVSSPPGRPAGPPAAGHGGPPRRAGQAGAPVARHARDRRHRGPDRRPGLRVSTRAATPGGDASRRATPYDRRDRGQPRLRPPWTSTSPAPSGPRPTGSPRSWPTARSSPSRASAASRSGRSPTRRTASGWPASPAPSSAASSGSSPCPPATLARRPPGRPISSPWTASPGSATAELLVAGLHGDAQGHGAERGVPRLRRRSARPSAARRRRRRRAARRLRERLAGRRQDRVRHLLGPQDGPLLARHGQGASDGARPDLRHYDPAGSNTADFDVNARAFDQPLISPRGQAIIYRRACSDVGTNYTVIGTDGTILMPAKEALMPAGYAWTPPAPRSSHGPAGLCGKQWLAGGLLAVRHRSRRLPV